jgi:hypothetical protein
MDQKSSFQKEAKRLLNDQNPEPFSDQEINEILELLNVYADIIYQSMTQNS